MGKIGITCRQPFLGALDWVEREIKRAAGTRIDSDGCTTNSKNPVSASNVVSSIQKKTRNKNYVNRNTALAKEFACKKCRALTTGKMCPVCKSTELSKGLVWNNVDF